MKAGGYCREPGHTAQHCTMPQQWRNGTGTVKEADVVKEMASSLLRFIPRARWHRALRDALLAAARSEAYQEAVGFERALEVVSLETARIQTARK